jgi:hypothetical protein
MEYKYKNLDEFRKHHGSEYKKLQRNNLLERFCNDMKWKLPNQPKPSDYWTKERCIEDALKYNTKAEWVIGNSSSYNAAYKNGWVKECSIHMYKFKDHGHWMVKENCIAEALKYKTKTEWFNASQASKSAARRNGWMEECTQHMIKRNKSKGYWTKELCLEDALKYKTRVQWQKTPKTGYHFARKNGWMEECTQHMILTKKPAGFWNKERCLEDALKYGGRYEWQKNSGSYTAARKNGWFDECIKHMK